MNTNILLESGTGELEILEFVIGNTHYAINVIKIKEIMDIDKVTKLPEVNPSIEGIMLYRNRIVTVVDLRRILGKGNKTSESNKALICEFNKVVVAFKIDSIIGVHRIKWEEIKKPEEILIDSLVIGNIMFDGKIIFLIDYEKVVTDISPSTGISEDRIVDVDYKDRPGVKIVLADDSPLIRKLLKDTLTKAGFKSLTFFDDGKQALDYIEGLQKEKGENFIEDVQILITDIEMPQMDGHTLTRKIKENHILNKLPVILFSSLITEELKHKGEMVGADAQMSKPDIAELVQVVDQFISRTAAQKKK